MADSYYSNQALPHFSGRTARQRGSGIGALVAGASTIAIPLAKKYLLPVAKRFGRQLLAAGVSEAGEVIARKKSARQALKGTVSRAMKSQFGGGVRKKKSQNTRRKRAKRSNQSQKPKRGRSKKKTNSKRKRHSSSHTRKRSRLSFFSNVKNDY